MIGIKNKFRRDSLHVSQAVLKSTHRIPDTNKSFPTILSRAAYHGLVDVDAVLHRTARIRVRAPRDGRQQRHGLSASQKSFQMKSAAVLGPQQLYSA